MSSVESSSSPSPSSMDTNGATPHNYRIVGVILAIGSGILIGSSFVFKKKGLIASQRGGEAGVGVAYLKSALWWTGMIMMIVGELCNFGAYAFVEAIIVTPLGALSVVICAILSSIFLNEKLSFFGWIGCFQCIVGSVIIALNGPKEQSVSTISEFKDLFLAPGFLAFGSVVIVFSIVIVLFIAPKYGRTHMIWYILVCSLIGGLSVSCTQGLGASIVTSIRGDNQFKNWFTYFLLGFVAVTLLTEIYFLNVALALFNTAMVTPTYYVIFTFCTLVTSVILYQGLKSTATQIITVVLGFLVICMSSFPPLPLPPQLIRSAGSGIILLQMSKIDPEKLQKEHNLDRRSTLLLKVAQEEVKKPDGDAQDITKDEEPGLDALRGFNGLSGTLARARRRSSAYTSEGDPTHSFYVPGLGRHPSRHRAMSTTSSASQPNGTPMMESHLSPPPSLQLSKAKTAPPGGGSLTVAPQRPLTSFWHRRTGSGPRKTKISSSPDGGVELTKSNSGRSLKKPPPTRGPPTDGHSFAGESVPEEREDWGTQRRPSMETEPSMRTLLARLEQQQDPQRQNSTRKTKIKFSGSVKGSRHEGNAHSGGDGDTAKANGIPTILLSSQPLTDSPEEDGTPVQNEPSPHAPSSSTLRPGSSLTDISLSPALLEYFGTPDSGTLASETHNSKLDDDKGEEKSVEETQQRNDPSQESTTDRPHSGEDLQRNEGGVEEGEPTVRLVRRSAAPSVMSLASIPSIVTEDLMRSRDGSAGLRKQ